MHFRVDAIVHTLYVQSQIFVLILGLAGTFRHVQIHDTVVLGTFDLFSKSVLRAANTNKDNGSPTLKCIMRCSVPALSFWMLDLGALYQLLLLLCPCTGGQLNPTYAIGRARLHLFHVGSPKARICLAGPSSSLTLESSLI